MIYFHRVLIPTFVFTLIATSACAPQPTKSDGIAFTVVYENMNCPFEEKRLQALGSRQEAEALFGTKPALKTSIDSAPQAAPTSEISDALAKTDFDKETWVLIAWGTQPNPGHRPATGTGPAYLRDGTLQLPLSLKKPADGEMYTQVIVTPCQVASVPVHEPIKRIELK